MQNLIFYLNVYSATTTEPARVESSRPYLKPKELTGAFEELGIKKFSQRNLPRYHREPESCPIKFDKEGGRFFYPLDEVNKYLERIWKKERDEIKRHRDRYC